MVMIIEILNHELMKVKQTILHYYDGEVQKKLMMMGDDNDDVDADQH